MRTWGRTISSSPQFITESNLCSLSNVVHFYEHSIPFFLRPFRKCFFAQYEFPYENLVSALHEDPPSYSVRTQLALFALSTQTTNTWIGLSAVAIYQRWCNFYNGQFDAWWLTVYLTWNTPISPVTPVKTSSYLPTETCFFPCCTF